MPGPALGATGKSGVAGGIRTMKLDVEGPDVRGCRDPDVTSAASQDMGERSLSAWHHLKFLLCKVGLVIASAS